MAKCIVFCLLQSIIITEVYKMLVFGDNLKKYRKEKDLTQAALGKMVGVAESTISCYESGKRQPDLEIAQKLAEVLGASLDVLLGRIIDKPTYKIEVQFPRLLKEDNPNLEEYISEICEVVNDAVADGDIPAEDAEEIIKSSIDYLKFQISQRKK